MTEEAAMSASVATMEGGSAGGGVAEDGGRMGGCPICIGSGGIRAADNRARGWPRQWRRCKL